MIRTRPRRPLTLVLPGSPWRRYGRLFGGLLGVLVVAPLSLTGADLLSQGNTEFAKGNYQEAIGFYESEDETSEDLSAERLTRRFNAGVSWTEAGNLDKAVERFEEVSVRARGELRDGALYNSGCANFLRGKAQAQTALEVEDVDERIRKLTEAAQTYHAALGFFRKVDTSGESKLITEDTPYNIAVTKTALRAVLDTVTRLQEEKEQEAEDEALKSPAKLLVMLQQKEKLHRTASRALGDAPGASVRLSARRLRKSEVKNRQLAEKLLHSLEVAPGADEPQPTPEEAGRKAHAATALRGAVDAMKDSEVAYGTLKVTEAVGSHTRAVAALRTAREAFPLELPQLLEEATTVQSSVESAIERIQSDDQAGKEDGTGGLGETLVDALQDEVLQPLAGLLNPQRKGLVNAQVDEEDDVVWSTGLISQAKLSQPVAPEAPAQPGAPPQPQQPQLSDEELAALNEALQREGVAAREAAERVKTELAAGKFEPALTASAEVLAALERIRELLPKPPETAEDRLKKLIVKQSAAKEAAGALGALQDDMRKEAASTLEEKQRTDGTEAGAVAEELEARQDDKAKRAGAKVREGESEVFASAEALRRGQESAATTAIERDIEAFHEALAILTGQDEQGQDQQQQGQDQQDQQDQQQNQDQPQDQEQQQQQQKDQSAYALSPDDARREQEKMDRQRREEEAKIFANSSNVTVEKDW